MLSNLTLSKRSLENIHQLESCLGEVYLFVGAGLSVRSGLSNWTTLCEQLAARFEVDANDLGAGLDLITILNRLFHRDNLRFLIYLEDALNRDNVTPSEAHKALVNLPSARRIFTTNVDTLLEATYHSQSVAFTKIVANMDASLLDSVTRPVIVKLHGCIHNKPSIVFTKEDYVSVEQSNKELLDLFAHSLVGHPFLFIGYNFGAADLHLQKILHERAQRGAQFARTSYAILFRENEDEVMELAGLGIKAICLEEYADLDVLLPSLGGIVGPRRDDVLPRLPDLEELNLVERDIVRSVQDVGAIGVDAIVARYAVRQDVARLTVEALVRKGVLRHDSDHQQYLLK